MGRGAALSDIVGLYKKLQKWVVFSAVFLSGHLLLFFAGWWYNWIVKCPPLCGRQKKKEARYFFR